MQSVRSTQTSRLRTRVSVMRVSVREYTIQIQNKTFRVLKKFWKNSVKMEDDLFAAFETEEPAKILKKEKNGDSEHTE